jgi:hypothetical protein
MPPKSMSAAHKKALAEGRNEGRIVKAYLDALAENRPRRGRRRTQESITKRLAAITEEMAAASSLKRLQLAQERRDLEAELATLGKKSDLAAMEREFIKVAKSYGERKGISYAAWRELNVPADVLQKAGITRASR